MRFVHCIVHTHWDREWYHTAARFQARLARLLDGLLPRLERGELPSFLLDGQAVVLDDYAALRPHQVGRLRRQLEAGRLECGPWYVLPDELLVSGESLVRNLLAGRRAVARAGGRAMAVGYSPDAFGHSAALPAILSGFGLDVAIAWRGFAGAGDLNWWEAPDGSRVVLVHLPRQGYECGAGFPTAAEAAAARWRELSRDLGARARSEHLLVMLGADHHAPPADLAAVLRSLELAAAPDTVRVGKLEDYARAVRSAADLAREGLEVVRGELVSGRSHAWTLLGTHGTRVYLKQSNAYCQRLLERRAEPLAALSALRGGPAFREELEAAWRTLLENHPHDSICGTSSDGVHREMMVRFERTSALGEEIVSAALDSLTGRDPARARAAGRERWQSVLLVVQPQARTTGQLVEAEITQFVHDVGVGQLWKRRAGRSRAPAPPPPPVLRGADGRVLPWQELDRSPGHELVESPEHYPDCDAVIVRRVVIDAGELPALSVVPVVIQTQAPEDERTGSEPPRLTAVAVDEHGMDNGALWLRVESDGTVAVADRLTGHSAHGLGAVEDERDLGDSYTSSPRGVFARVPDAVAVRVVHSGPLRGELEIVRRFDASRLTLFTRVVLDAGARHASFAFAGENHVTDHRLRAVFPLGARPLRVVADGQFGPVERSVAVPARRAAREREAPYPTAAMQRWVAVGGRRLVLAVHGDGLTQYEARANGEVCITLLRACGELSREDLPERPGHAGWPTPTPEGQCMGPFSSRVAVSLHPPEELERLDQIEAVSEAFLAPPYGVMRRASLEVPHPVAGPELVGDGLAFTAFKPAEDGRGVVLRCVNLRAHRTGLRWLLPVEPAEAERCRMDETATASLPVEGGALELEALAREVVTVRVLGRGQDW